MVAWLRRFKLPCATFMATELHSMNYITHRFEKLPLNDGYASEKLPSLIHYHESMDRNTKTCKINKKCGHVRDNSTNRSSYEMRAGFNEHSKALQDEAKSNRIIDIFNKKDTIFSNEDFISWPALLDDYGLLSTGCGNSNDAIISNKRKRSTDSTGSESSKSSCDEEIRKLGLSESKTLQNIQISSHGMKPAFQRNLDNLADVCSPHHVKKQLSKSQSNQKRPKNRSPMDLSFSKQTSTPSSVSWFPYRFRSGERKVKLIRVTPIKPDGSSFESSSYADHFREDAFFRPIRVEDE